MNKFRNLLRKAVDKNHELAPKITPRLMADTPIYQAIIHLICEIHVQKFMVSLFIRRYYSNFPTTFSTSSKISPDLVSACIVL